ncbi:hypothetical protein J7M28_09900 [bacterium]|nr:hypothetical protein [bacterium]
MKDYMGSDGQLDGWIRAAYRFLLPSAAYHPPPHFGPKRTSEHIGNSRLT